MAPLILKSSIDMEVGCQTRYQLIANAQGINPEQAVNGYRQSTSALR